MARLRRIVIKEELVALTGDYKKAIILNQLMYWSERVQDADLLREEDKKRITYDVDYECKYGWIYKKAEELSMETMMDIRPKAMREHLKYLVAHGWLFERRNPQDKMDRTLQYRVNLLQIQKDLKIIGYEWEKLVLDNGEGQKEDRKYLCNLSNVPKEPLETIEIDAPTSDKESTTELKVVGTKAFQASDSCTKITTEITETEIITQQQQDRVVVVQARIEKLFNKKISRKNMESLIRLADKAHANLDEAIDNTFQYHIKVEPCRNVVGAIRYALESGEWEVSNPKSSIIRVKPLPKAVQRQIEEKKKSVEKKTDPLILKKVEEVKRKIKALYEDPVSSPYIL